MSCQKCRVGALRAQRSRALQNGAIRAVMACSIKIEHLLTKHINTLSFAHLKTCRMMKRSSLFRGCFFCIKTAVFRIGTAASPTGVSAFCPPRRRYSFAIRQ